MVTRVLFWCLNTKMTLSWALKQLVTRVHALLSIYTMASIWWSCKTATPNSNRLNCTYWLNIQNCTIIGYVHWWTHNTFNDYRYVSCFNGYSLSTGVTIDFTQILHGCVANTRTLNLKYGSKWSIHFVGLWCYCTLAKQCNWMWHHNSFMVVMMNV